VRDRRACKDLQRAKIARGAARPPARRQPARRPRASPLSSPDWAACGRAVEAWSAQAATALCTLHPDDRAPQSAVWLHAASLMQPVATGLGHHGSSESMAGHPCACALNKFSKRTAAAVRFTGVSCRPAAHRSHEQARLTTTGERASAGPPSARRFSAAALKAVTPRPPMSARSAANSSAASAGQARLRPCRTSSASLAGASAA
jgi:hypothetical protein